MAAGQPPSTGAPATNCDCRAAALLMAAVLTLVTNSALSPALPALELAFPKGPDTGLKTRMLLTAPSLAAAIAAPIAGLVADALGRRRQLLFGVLLYALAGSAGLYLTNLDQILASRCLLGIAVAMIFTSQVTLIGDYFVGGARTRQLGLQLGVAHLIAAVIVLLAGLLAALSPKLPFAIYLVPLAILPLMRCLLIEVGPTSPDTIDPAADLPGSGWSIAVVLIGVTLGAGMAVAWLLPTELPFVFGSSGLDGPGRSGLVLALGMVVAGLLAIQAGWLRARFGAGSAIALGLATMAAGFAVLSGTVATLGAIVGVGAVFGGFALMVTHLDALTLDLAPPKRRGIAIGLVNTALFLGQSLSPVAFHGLIRDQGLAWVFGMAAALTAVAGAVFALGMRSYDGGDSAPRATV